MIFRLLFTNKVLQHVQQLKLALGQSKMYFQIPIILFTLYSHFHQYYPHLIDFYTLINNANDQYN